MVQNEYGKYELGLGGLGIIVKSLSVHHVSFCLIFLFINVAKLPSDTFKDLMRLCNILTVLFLFLSMKCLAHRRHFMAAICYCIYNKPFLYLSLNSTFFLILKFCFSS